MDQAHPVQHFMTSEAPGSDGNITGDGGPVVDHIQHRLPVRAAPLTPGVKAQGMGNSTLLVQHDRDRAKVIPEQVIQPGLARVAIAALEQGDHQLFADVALDFGLSIGAGDPFHAAGIRRFPAACNTPFSGVGFVPRLRCAAVGFVRMSCCSPDSRKQHSTWMANGFLGGVCRPLTLGRGRPFG